MIYTAAQSEALNQTKKIHDHARGCKKPLEDCRVCKTGIAYFAALPLLLLSFVLREATDR